MKREDRELLLKDLSARLPYEVKVNFKVNNIAAIANKFIFNVDGEYSYITHGKSYLTLDIIKLLSYNYLDEIKPYLFPLSSLSEEMLEELNANGFFKYCDTIANVSHLESKNGISEEVYTYIDIECISFLIEYFHSHHIDYLGLIEKGLAIDATGLNIY